MGNYHVRFWNGGGAGDRSTDRSAADRAIACGYWRLLRAFGLFCGEGSFPHPRGGLCGCR